MIRAEYYESLYLVIVFVLTIISVVKYSSYKPHRLGGSNKENPSKSLWLCAFMIFFIGIRPVSDVFVDMLGYYYHWDDWNFGVKGFFWDQQNLLFDNLRIFLASSNVSARVFFFLIAFIYFGTMWWACRRMFPRDTLFAFLVCLAAFSTFSYGTNGIKAGVAASIFLLAVSYNDRAMITTLLALISIGFHHSMIMVAVSYAIICIIKKPQFYFAIWLICIIIAAAHITFFQSFFSSLVDEQGQEYLSKQLFGKGFRIDFILYSAMPILIGYYAVFKKRIKSKQYMVLLNLYLLTNSIWLLCMYAEFTNRIAYLSWFLYPVVIIYPFLKEVCGNNQYKVVSMIAMIHIAFSMFMTFVFYA